MPDGTLPENFDSPFYSDIPYSRSLTPDAIVSLIERLPKDPPGVLLASSSVDHDEERVAPSIARAYDRELARLGKVLAARLGPPKIADATESGFVGFRWTVDGTPIVLTAHQEDGDLPIEIFVTRVTKSMRPYLPRSLARLPPKRTSTKREPGRRRAP